ncbi:hypothetical protein [Teichococcus wenyumeiae]|uniref:hypothetical protein n=1 Tax=Teichococcus wenyumeiae TaxID=2478470 RepID=UPI0018F6EB62|nr:hypothetical protein [Pseudoroseomonas wenyumeiae]
MPIVASLLPTAGDPPPSCHSRKDALFATGGDGGARLAAIASLLETRKLNGVSPQ